MKIKLIASLVAATILTGCSSSSGSKNDTVDPEFDNPRAGIENPIEKEKPNDGLIYDNNGNVIGIDGTDNGWGLLPPEDHPIERPGIDAPIQDATGNIQGGSQFNPETERGVISADSGESIVVLASGHLILRDESGAPIGVVKVDEQGNITSARTDHHFGNITQNGDNQYILSTGKDGEYIVINTDGNGRWEIEDSGGTGGLSPDFGDTPDWGTGISDGKETGHGDIEVEAGNTGKVITVTGNNGNQIVVNTESGSVDINGQSSPVYVDDNGFIRSVDNGLIIAKVDNSAIEKGYVTITGWQGNSLILQNDNGRLMVSVDKSGQNRPTLKQRPNLSSEQKSQLRAKSRDLRDAIKAKVERS
ncbi:hypothetical protein [Photobacterium rosenbergii]|uniref:hypothetical protein n=1 Tax=Photobacterium rosenbergii TaxID=294936 RepID=UPI001C99CE5C|nr:hypothetical protein [Photobacterium rosenbergii]MBY5948248.1 hypothetical protein [Photobacterium rosenbergii]